MIESDVAITREGVQWLTDFWGSSAHDWLHALIEMRARRMRGRPRNETGGDDAMAS